MPRVVKELTALEVKRLTYEGLSGRASGVPVFKAVGGVAGLQLQLTEGEGRSWSFRYTLPGGQRRSIGLGSYPEVGLADARDAAREVKRLIREGIDPIRDREAKRKQLMIEQGRMTFAKAIDGWEEENPNKFNDKYRKQFLSNLRKMSKLGPLRVDEITEEDVWAELEPIANRTPKSVSKIRSSVVAILNFAEDARQRSGPNPAATGWVTRKIKAKTEGVKTEHQPALQVEDAPRFFAALREREGMGSRALEFVALTAARSGEVSGAVWDELDLDKAVWTVPAERMKMKRDHTVPLSPQAVALLKALPRMKGNPLMFPAPRGGQLSDMTLSAGMKRIHKDDEQGFVDADNGRPAVPHGLRSTFRVWAGQRGFSRELAELALAHSFGDSVEQAYQRDIYTEQRRPMMDAWANYLEGVEAATVVQLHANR